MNKPSPDTVTQKAQEFRIERLTDGTSVPIEQHLAYLLADMRGGEEEDDNEKEAV